MSLLSNPKSFAVERVERVYSPLGTSEKWSELGTLSGWLDLLTGTDQPNGGTDAAFIEESTHVLISRGMPEVIPTDADRVVGPLGRVYHISYVDDVTGVGHHLEIYLRLAGREAE